MNTDDDIIDTAKQFVATNIVELCQDCIELDQRSIVAGNKLKQLRDMLDGVASYQSLRLAVSLVSTEAMKLIAAGK